jgi:hypothetical protein
MTYAMRLALGLFFTGVALAAPADKPPDTGPPEWKQTHLKKYDDFFADATEPIANVRATRALIVEARSTVARELELGEPVTMDYALRSLAEAGGPQLTITRKGGDIAFAYAADAPQAVRTSADALNQMLVAVRAAAPAIDKARADLKGMRGKGRELVSPGQLKKDLDRKGRKTAEDHAATTKQAKQNLTELNLANDEAMQLWTHISQLDAFLVETFREGQPKPTGGK